VGVSGAVLRQLQNPATKLEINREQSCVL
jgi:hypothetical protein